MEKNVFSSIESSSKIPDGGWGWTVVCGSFMISLLTDGFSYTSGVFYEKFLNIYNESETVTAIYVSVMTGMISCMGPFASGLSQTYGCRAVTMAGATLAVVGMVLSTAFDHNMYCHAVTLGVLVGGGLGLMFLPQVTIVTEWFDRRLSLATGIAVCGSGFGMALFALMSDALIQSYTWKGAMLILAGLMSFCIVFAWTFRDPPYKVALAAKQQVEPSLRAAIKETFNFSILTNPLFTYFVVINSIASSVYYVPLILTSDRMIRLGFGSSRDGASLMVFFGISNGIARTVFGYISDLHGVNRTVLYAVGIILMGFVVAMTTLASSLVHMQLLYVGLGITEGLHATLMSVVLVDQFGLDRLYNTLGIVLLFDGISSMLGPPITNLLVAYDSTYQCSIWLCAGLTIFSGACLLLMPLLKMYLEKPPLLDKEAGIVVAVKSGHP